MSRLATFQPWANSPSAARGMAWAVLASLWTRTQPWHRRPFDWLMSFQSTRPTLQYGQWTHRADNWRLNEGVATNKPSGDDDLALLALRILLLVPARDLVELHYIPPASPPTQRMTRHRAVVRPGYRVRGDSTAGTSPLTWTYVRSKVTMCKRRQFAPSGKIIASCDFGSSRQANCFPRYDHRLPQSNGRSPPHTCW